MRVVWFAHSLVSDWNHGNAHFLRGVVREFLRRGHDVDVYESCNAWARSQLLQAQGEAAVADFRAAFPALTPRLYDLETIDVARETDGADLVVVHEWNEPWLVAELGRVKARGARFRLLFHDTHHRAVTAPEQMARFDLTCYDGVLAYGAALRDVYVERGWGRRVWVWHEAADAELFRPLPVDEREGDLVWIGNWGDDERTRELHEFLIAPARALRLSGSVYGVRYPPAGVRRVERAGLRYRGWIANHRVPEVFARHRVTVHVPRRPYVEALPGIPTIRPFEALACGIPLVSSPWEDVEGLFEPGRDYLVARDGRELREHLRAILADDDVAASLARHGRQTILARHTCAHRVDELLAIAGEIGLDRAA
jgi:spore maturation protein CgeB